MFMFTSIFKQNRYGDKYTIVKFNNSNTVCVSYDDVVFDDHKCDFMPMFKIISLDTKTKGYWFKFLFIPYGRKMSVKRNYFPKWTKPFSKELYDFLCEYINSPRALDPYSVADYIEVKELETDFFDSPGILSGDNATLPEPITDNMIKYVDSLFEDLRYSNTMHSLFY